MKANTLGLPVEETKQIAAELNHLLSNFQTYYQNLRGIHWNIRGKRFFDLHLKFEELYNDAQLKVDAVAERILTLGGTPLHTFADYVEHSEMRIGKDINNDVEAITLIIDSVGVLLKLERSLLQKAADINDEGTNSMMSDFIQEQEKLLWMLNAWMD